ncbi:unnamed protein product [Boreogadus saida]
MCSRVRGSVVCNEHFLGAVANPLLVYKDGRRSQPERASARTPGQRHPSGQLSESGQRVTDERRRERLVEDWEDQRRERLVEDWEDQRRERLVEDWEDQRRRERPVEDQRRRERLVEDWENQRRRKRLVEDQRRRERLVEDWKDWREKKREFGAGMREREVLVLKTG